MKKLSVLFATLFVVALSVTSCKKTVNSNEFDKKDTTVVVVVNSTVVIDSSNVDSILQKR